MSWWPPFRHNRVPAGGCGSDQQRITELQTQLDMTKAKILALLAIIATLQNTAVTDTAAIADLKKQIADLHASDAELQDPELIAAVDAVIGNAAATPPPAAPAPAPMATGETAANG